MASPSSRVELINHCLRKLGAPVVEINVDDQQLEDRLDDALQFFQEYNSDAVVKTYLKHQITSDDANNGYIEVSDNIVFVKKLFPITASGTTSGNFFDFKYQMSLNEIYDLNTFIGDLAYYEQMRQYISLIEMKLTGHPQITFNRLQNRVYIHGDFSTQEINVGDYIVLEVFSTVDGETYTDVYNDIFLKDYLTQLIKQQWGTNLSKFEGMQLPGGVTLNGRIIYEEATQELERLEEKVRLNYELPVDFFLG
tara:strand:+ start:1023 stop:1778 length:756 start_codon:yes stop_codon:yes gene_type:complete